MPFFNPVGNAGTPFDPGTYVATCIDIEPIEHKDFGLQFRWKFHLSPDLSSPEDIVVQEDGETPAELWSNTGRTMGGKAHCRKYIEAFLNRGLEPGEDLEKEDVIGKYATVALVDNEGSDKTVYSKVAAISPYKGAPSKARVRARKIVEESDLVEEVSNDDGLPF